MANKEDNNQVKLIQKLQLAEKHIKSIIIVCICLKSREMEDIKPKSKFQSRKLYEEMKNTLNGLTVDQTWLLIILVNMKAQKQKIYKMKHTEKRGCKKFKRASVSCELTSSSIVYI